jgi:UDP-glucose 4-epimerase
MKVFVTGAAGFIGSHICERLLTQEYCVTGWDNLSTGHMEFLKDAISNPNFTFTQGDNLQDSELTNAMRGHDIVIHLAANADVRQGLDYPSRDLEQNTIATAKVLEAARKNKVKRVCFSSTGSIYGEPQQIPTPENAQFPVQTSLYGASKLAGEGLLQAYAVGYGMQVNIYRFVSILGERYTHGHILDFCRQLAQHPDHLKILGNGRQEKSYLYVHDCVEAIIHTINAPDLINIFNLGRPDTLTVDQSVHIICQELQVQPKLQYRGGDRGWTGDSPLILLDTKKITGTGWSPQVSLEDAVRRTVRWILRNQTLAFAK